MQLTGSVSQTIPALKIADSAFGRHLPALNKISIGSKYFFNKIYIIEKQLYTISSSIVLI